MDPFRGSIRRKMLWKGAGDSNSAHLVESQVSCKPLDERPIKHRASNTRAAIRRRSYLGPGGPLVRSWSDGRSFGLSNRTGDHCQDRRQRIFRGRLRQARLGERASISTMQAYRRCICRPDPSRRLCRDRWKRSMGMRRVQLQPAGEPARGSLGRPARRAYYDAFFGPGEPEIGAACGIRTRACQGGNLMP